MCLYGGTGFLSGCTNSELEIYFPKLKTINDFTGSTKNGGSFGSVINVTLPPSVTYVGKWNFYANQTITLNCNTATFNSNWCYSTPTVNFTMCDDWYPSINIAVAAANHTKDWFIDLFRNKLYDHSITSDTGDGGVVLSAGEITIPLAIFEAMTEDELAIAENKNWTVGGA